MKSSDRSKPKVERISVLKSKEFVLLKCSGILLEKIDKS